MKVMVIGNRERYEKYAPDSEAASQVEMVYFPLGTEDRVLLESCKDAQGLVVDAIGKVSGELIQGLPDLKWIQSEGVGYNGIDVEAASKRNIPVCNNKGINAGAVAEQTVLLILALLRDFFAGDQAVRQGNQIQKKEEMMIRGFMELSECTVGLIGLGDIGKATAKLLGAFGSKVYYHKTHPLTMEEESGLNVTYLELDDMLAKCNVISLHVPVTPQTREMVNEEFLGKMRKDAWLINTARGEIVDNDALRKALEEDWILGAGLDTVAPEPTSKDNVLVDLPEEVRSKVVYSPHIAGVSTGTFRRAHENIWENIRRVSLGEKPMNQVNN